MNDKFSDVANNAINKNREYNHTTDKEIETKKKTKKVRRFTNYKSVPSIAVDYSDMALLISLANLVRDTLEKKTDRGPYLEDILKRTSKVLDKYTNL